MDLLVYRIDEGILGKIVNYLKRPPLPVRYGLHGAAPGNVDRAVTDLLSDNFYVLSDAAEIERFEDPRGYRLTPDVYYLRHPLKARTNWLIPAAEFHAWIVREQIADIVSFLRAELAVKKIDFEVVDGASLDLLASGKVPTEAGVIPVEGSVTFAKDSEYKFVLEAKKPLRPSEKRRGPWLDSFPDVQAAVDGMTDSTLSIHTGSNTTFGIGAKVADILKIDAKFLQKQTWRLLVET